MVIFIYTDHFHSIVSLTGNERIRIVDNTSHSNSSLTTTLQSGKNEGRCSAGREAHNDVLHADTTLRKLLPAVSPCRSPHRRVCHPHASAALWLLSDG